MNLTLPKRLVRQTSEVLLLGFGNGVEEFLSSNFPPPTQMKFWEMNNSFSAYQWLEERAARGRNNLPDAVIVNLGPLRQENYLFLENLKRHLRLRLIPVIGIAFKKGEMPAKKSAMQQGLDDGYIAPVDWRRLENRMQFLIKYKATTYFDEFAQNEAAGIVKIPFWKRSFDVLVASLAILTLSPVFALIALLVKLESKGPVVYASRRVGTGYKVFYFLKFRSMYQDADKRLAELSHLNKYNSDDKNGALFLKFENDPRITKVGKFIRKTSLDELPQLFNVLKGDMSIVGNRPLPLYEAEKLTRDEWARRFLAPAGITGLWQVAKGGKDNMTVEERVGLDVEYARKGSFSLDFQILLKTLPAMLQRGE